MFLDIVLQYNLLLPVFEEVRKIIMKALALVGSHIQAWTQEKQWAHRNLKVLKQTVSKVASPSKLDLWSSILNLCNSRQFDVNSTFYSIRSTTLSTPFEYNTVQEILTNKQLSLSVTLKTAEISVMLP